MFHLFNLLFGPRLYYLYNGHRPYQPNLFEFIGDKLLSLASGVYGLSIALSPIIIPYLILNCPVSSYGSVLRNLVLFYTLSYSLRTLGRLTNGDYNHFAGILEASKNEPQNAENRLMLKQYDFQILAAPEDYSAIQSRSTKWFVQKQQIPNLSEPLNTMRDVAAHIAVKTFGRRMLYPGSLEVINSMVNSQLVDGRKKLIEDKGGQRNIIMTEDGNKLDTIFIDKSGPGKRGDILVICCEGNAGFFETGIMVAPLSLGYSVLGWNAPGFGESTGIPTTEAILMAMEATMQFAIRKLGFKENQICLFGWSIGGFPATWAAANYPQIHGLILDASFDDLVPLALARMPSAIGGFVRYIVQKHLNLPVAEQLNRYRGPVLIIRRWNDEIIVSSELDEDIKRASNRANWLLLNLLRNRYPGLVQNEDDEKCVFEWLRKEPQNRILEYPPEDSMEPEFPSTDLLKLDRERRNRLIHQLCTALFVDYMDAGHNVPLDSHYFNIPKPIFTRKSPE